MMDQSGKVVFVDFEYAIIGPSAFDLANHFCEWMANYANATPELMNPDDFPLPEEMLVFVQSYVDACKCETLDAKCLLDLVLEMVPLSHLLWSYWALIQAMQSNIKFNYLQ